MRAKCLTFVVFASPVFANPLQAQDCSQPDIGDRLQVSHRVESAVPPAVTAVLSAGTVTTGILVEYTRDTLHVVERTSSPPVHVHMPAVTHLRVACGRDWLLPVLLSVSVGAAIGYSIPSLDPLGLGGSPDPDAQRRTAVFGALVGVPIGLAISTLRTRWVGASLPPQPGVMAPDQVIRMGPRSGRTRTAVGGALVATGLGLLVFDPSLSDDGTPYVLGGIGLALGVWGLVAMLRD